MKLSYELYLQSPEWAALRKKALSRWHHRCVICGSSFALEVHHITYKRPYFHRLFALLSLCREHHAAMHGLAADEIKNQTRRTI
jgi:5-methylcytosine-specific restriction endonuclease McrA